MAKFGPYDRSVQIYPPEAAAAATSCCDVLPAIGSPLIFEFPSNNVLQFGLTDPGLTTARVAICATLGNGTSTLYSGGYTGDGSGDGLYNPVDDKIYFLSRKYDTTTAGAVSLATWKNMFVQWDPRTLTISDEVELPAGWCVSQGPEGGTSCTGQVATLVDVTDRRAWLMNRADNAVMSLSLTGLTEMYSATTSDSFVTSYVAGLAIISGANDNVVLQDSTTACLRQLETIGPTASEFVEVRKLLDVADIPILTETGDIRHYWLHQLNRLFLYYAGGGVNTRIGVLLDLNNGGVRYVMNDSVTTYSITRPFWDPLTGRVYGVEGSAGIVEITADGEVLGRYGDDGNWGTGQPMGGSIFMWSFTFDGGGEFTEGDLTNRNSPVNIFPTSAWTTQGESFDSGPDKPIFVPRQYLMPRDIPLPGGVTLHGVPLQGGTWNGFPPGRL